MNWTQISFWVCLQRWNSLYKESQWWPRIRRCKIRSSGAIQTAPLGRSQKIGYKNFEKSSPNKNLTKSGKKWRKSLCFFPYFSNHEKSDYHFPNTTKKKTKCINPNQTWLLLYEPINTLTRSLITNSLFELIRPKQRMQLFLSGCCVRNVHLFNINDILPSIRSQGFLSFSLWLLSSQYKVG